MRVNVYGAIETEAALVAMEVDDLGRGDGWYVATKHLQPVDTYLPWISPRHTRVADD